MKLEGLYNFPYLSPRIESKVPGSRSTKIERGTKRDFFVSLKYTLRPSFKTSCFP